MIDRQYGRYSVSCDVCGRVLDDDTYDDFQDALDGLKANGWKSVNNCGMWDNYCPECAAKLSRPGASEFAGIGG